MRVIGKKFQFECLGLSLVHFRFGKLDFQYEKMGSWRDRAPWHWSRLVSQRSGFKETIWFCGPISLSMVLYSTAPKTV